MIAVEIINPVARIFCFLRMISFWVLVRFKVVQVYIVSKLLGNYI